ncbi:MAG: hypothetical protein AABN95_06715 [Acidobacteriota bacterium]
MKRKRKSASISEDMHDSEKDLRSYPLLSEALEGCRLIEQKYLEVDEVAGAYQRRHKRIVAVAAIFGTLAIILAILQLTLSHLYLESGHENEISLWLMVSEGVSVLLAAGAVCWGTFAHVHHKWLDYRHRAERYRLLKFAALIKPAIPGVGHQEASAWKARLIAAMAEIARSSADDWAVEEDPHDRPPGINEIDVSQEGIRALIDYYLQKRLRIQKRYFGQQARRHDKSNSYTRLPAPIFFFVSVFFALLHVVIEGVTKLGHEGDAVQHQESIIAVVLIAAAAILPVCGGGIRTARAAFEFSRHTLRFRAKYNALSKLEESLELHRDKLAQLDSGEQADAALAEAIYGDLWMCELVLETEQREWLRLMIEAEWFA